MTDTEMQLPAGRELDALIAERVDGWLWQTQTVAGKEFRNLFPPPESIYPRWAWDMYRYYSTDIHAAMYVLHKAGTNYESVAIYRLSVLTPYVWHVQLSNSRTGLMANGSGDTIPLAICRAALQCCQPQPSDHDHDQQR